MLPCFDAPIFERYVNQLISATQVFRHLRANCAEHRPCHESQVRPLTGVTPEQTKVASNPALDNRGVDWIHGTTDEVLEIALDMIAHGWSPDPDRRRKPRHLD
jgi:hypothetical protein